LVIAAPVNNNYLKISVLVSLETLGDFEVIIIDGGSNDQTTEIAQAFGAKIVLLPHAKEFPSRNAGAALALGEIILFTGADMLFPEDIFGKIAEKFKGPSYSRGCRTRNTLWRIPNDSN